jgi:putative transposase
VLLSFKYRLYPTQSQRNVLEYLLETHRRIYNDALKERVIAYKHAGKPVSVTYRMQADQLKAIRKFDEHAAFANFSSLQQTLRRLQKAYDAFFRRVKAGEDPGFPRFKGKGWFKSVCYVYGDGIRLDGDRLVVQRVGAIRMFQHRELPGSVKMVVLKRDGHGNWHAVFQVELPDVQPTEGDLNSVGIDMGLLSFAALSTGLSTGEEVRNPRFFRLAEKERAHLQQVRARCAKGSIRDGELSKRIRSLHERTANQRRDFQHKLSRAIVN